MITPCAAHVLRLDGTHAFALAQLEEQFFHAPWGRTQYEHAFQQKHFGAFGLFAEPLITPKAALLGYISFYHILDELEILNIAIVPSRRKQGLGRYLLKTTLQEVHKVGIHRAVLEVRTGNEDARKLYEALSFACVGVRRGYYADTGEDALIYEIHI